MVWSSEEGALMLRAMGDDYKEDVEQTIRGKSS